MFEVVLMFALGYDAEQPKKAELVQPPKVAGKPCPECKPDAKKVEPERLGFFRSRTIVREGRFFRSFRHFEFHGGRGRLFRGGRCK